MAEAFKREDPSGWIARQLIGASTLTHLMMRIDSTACAFASTAQGSLLQWQNPENVEVMAYIQLHVTTAGTGTLGYLDIGVGTLNGSADNLIDAGTIATVNLIVSSADDKGANGRTWRRMSAKGGTADYITGKNAGTGGPDSTAAARAYIFYVPIS